MMSTLFRLKIPSIFQDVSFNGNPLGFYGPFLGVWFSPRVEGRALLFYFFVSIGLGPSLDNSNLES